MAGIEFLIAILASAIAGIGVGFAAGLVPGLHMNNVAAAITGGAASSLGAFASMGSILGLEGSEAGLLASCFLSSAVVAHIFAEAVSSAYIGIPAGDVVSVLPAHRLAKAGLGAVAVGAAADGALVGIVLGSLLLFPFCALMGEPVRFYSVIQAAMGVLVIVFSCVLILSDAWPSLRLRTHVPDALRKTATAAAIFAIAGGLGMAVLQTNFYASGLPEFPWVPRPLQRSSLLLPLFAGLFGIPSLLLSLGSGRLADLGSSRFAGGPHRPRPLDLIMCVLGGAVVGWLPGMTSGSATTVCAPGLREDSEGGGIGEAQRFIWLYSSISASGAVFAVGALFVLSRARSGSMDAIGGFLRPELGQPWGTNTSVMGGILVSLLLSALASHVLLLWLNPRLARMRRVLCSRWLAVLSLGFVVSLMTALTGAHGLLLMSAAATLGLLPPLTGARRIQLMGCMLVPIAALLLGL